MNPARLAPALLLLALVGCTQEDAETPMETPPAPFRVATYNGGLAKGFVPYTDERAVATTEAIAALDLELLCVQEFWRPEDVARLQAAAAANLPNQHFLAPDPGDPGVAGPPCSDTELDPLQSCAEAACAEVNADGLAGCILGSCNPEFSATSGECSGCLAANIGGTFNDIRFSCTNSASGGYAYGGSFGIGLLTSAEVLEEGQLVFASSYNRRAVLFSRVKTSLGELNVFCTHLSAVFGDIPHPDEATGMTWVAEQALQIDEMIAFAEAKAAGGPILLLGDLNTGPERPGIAAEAPANYARFEPAGYSSEYLAQASPRCTFCADNLLVGGADDATSVIIDHILTKGVTATVSTERILTAPIELTVGGEPTNAHLSDHFGLQATLTAK